MKYLSAGQASLYAILSVSSLFSIASAWPTNNLRHSKFASRQSSDNPPSGGAEEEPKFNEEYDFVIAGGGTAGLVLANRLTESGRFSVLVLEAGPNPEQVRSYESPGGNQFIKGSVIDWGLLTTPQEHLNNRTLQYLRGRTLGGSSTTNGLYYARGSSSIYDQWERKGNPGWGWDSVYHFFVKSTKFNAPTTPELSAFSQDYKTFTPSLYGSGPLELGFQGYVPPSTDGFIVACSEAANIPVVEDLNNGDGFGIKHGTATLNSKLRRSSSYDSFYQQAHNRANLRVIHDSPVTGIVMSSPTNSSSRPRAIGVSYIEQRSGFSSQARARNEVIISMGAFHSPQLLMVSGIGPAEELAKVGIEPVVVNENVGKHLNDHSVFSIMARAQDFASTTDMSRTPESLREAQTLFYNNLTGPYTAPSGVTNGFQKLNESQLREIGAEAIIEAGLANQTHIEYLFESVWYPWIPTPFWAPLPNESYISITASSMVQLSRGTVTLRSASMSDSPLINSNYYADPTDAVIGIESFKYLRKILRHPALQQFTLGDFNGEVSPGPEVADDDHEAILEYIKANTIPNWHATGTNQMLPEEDGGVVNSKLQVYGVDGLRVIDCSIVPVLPDANILASIYMLAEKGAEMIREDWNDEGY
ncbi:similar to glucose-methanol-choline oxidoreductase:GMC oxidoreductase [Plenodomus lingam JN3]|uniref:Similar to glucose-methanol-choline oxidoreductase:GMC oxidoreductase n=1 Tax=Leptosphaeria maculans (strain JN3 / isolate v23.1.3 / race Av1-4-5-6-7-8) TaxID=985895 RepID=E4ZGZ9_LEPMJ|nr:similar to glucose-methanol-choline oxidoreductase:GMC oxidoreductase [Plenodomus lingam JN3]CBX90569.1 similar to glucose-methanol-choline oxidoreductase:GMC oxidoreductase [Plenodomus lingam JN3]